MNMRIAAIFALSLVSVGLKPSSLAEAGTSPSPRAAASSLVAPGAATPASVTPIPPTPAAASGSSHSSSSSQTSAASQTERQKHLLLRSQARKALLKDNEDSTPMKFLRGEYEGWKTFGKWAPRIACLISTGLFLQAQRTFSKAGAPSSFYLRLERAGLSIALQKTHDALKKELTEEESATIIAEQKQLEEQRAQVQRQLDRIEAKRSSANTRRYVFGTVALISAGLSLWPLIFSKYKPSADEIKDKVSEIEMNAAACTAAQSAS